MQCNVCYAFCHKYLTRCPVCGSALQESEYPRALDAWLRRNERPSDAEIQQGLDAYSRKMGWPLIALAETREAAVHGPYGAEWARSAAMWGTRQMLSQGPWDAYVGGASAMASVPLVRGESALQRGVRLADELLSRIQYRLVGSSTGGYGAADVGLRVTAEAIIVTDTGGTPVTTIPLAYLLAGAAQPDETAGRAWFGLSMGNAVAFANPSFTTGLWVLTYSDGQESLQQLAIGARSGIFAKKPGREWFQMANSTLMLATDIVTKIEAERLGLPSYLQALGFPPPEDPAPAQAAAADPSVKGALTSLDALRADGLVTDEEYSAKRIEILARL